MDNSHLIKEDDIAIREQFEPSQYFKLPQYDEQGNLYPWEGEPNFAYYTDKETGFNYIINRCSKMGFLRGYVEVKEADIPSLAHKQDEFEVHGGVTFIGKYNSIFFSKTPIYCLGFDCAHAFDLIPCLDYLDFDGRKRTFENDIYRDIKYVQKECKKLAKQIFDCLKDKK